MPGLKIPSAFAGADQHDDFIFNAELVADGLVVSDFRRLRGNQRVAIGAEFQAQHPGRGGQRHQGPDDQCRPGPANGVMRQPGKQTEPAICAGSWRGSWSRKQVFSQVSSIGLRVENGRNYSAKPARDKGKRLGSAMVHAPKPNLGPYQIRNPG